MTHRRAWVRAAALLVLAALVAGRWAAVSTVERLWARSLGVERTLGAIAQLKLTLLALALTGALVWSLGNLYLVYRSIGSVHVPRRLGNLEILEAVPRRYLLAGTALLALGLAAALSSQAASWWYPFALLAYPAVIGKADPVLHRDLGYFLFRLPWERTLTGYLTSASAALLATTGVLYGLVGAIRVVRHRLSVVDRARVHLAGLLATFALVLAAGFRLAPAEYLATAPPLQAAADLVRLRATVSGVLGGLALVAALLSLAWIWIDRIAVVVIPWSALAAAALVGTVVLPAAAGAPGPAPRARPAAAPQELLALAFGLPERDTGMVLPAARGGSGLDARAREEILLAPVWSGTTLAAWLDQKAPRRPYDHFTTPELACYRTDGGRPVPVYLAAREVDLLAAEQQPGALSWSDAHQGPYSHARGVVAVAANRTGEAGEPLFLPDLARPDSASPQPADLLLARADLWFGPAAEAYAIAGRAQGQPGIAPGGAARRLALAWTLQSLRFLSSEAVPSDRVVLWRRAVRQRLERYAPFARFGVPYPVVASGRLWWLAWGYVAAEAFPLSPPVDWHGRSVRYLRASLIGAVEAHTGATRVYLLPQADPLSAAWAALAPDVVGSLEELPAAVRAHLRYPDELLPIQARLLFGDGATLGGPPGRQRGVAAGQRRAPVWLVASLPGDPELRLRLRLAIPPDQPGGPAAIVDGSMDGAAPILRVVRLLGSSMPVDRPLAAAAGVGTTLADGGGLVSGPAMPLVLAAGALAVGSVFEVPAATTAAAARAPRLQEVWLGDGAALGRGPDLARALSDFEAASRVALRGAADWQAARDWFVRLDQARRAGDWEAFGRAYEQLRRLLAAPRDSGP